MNYSGVFREISTDGTGDAKFSQPSRLVHCPRVTPPAEGNAFWAGSVVKVHPHGKEWSGRVLCCPKLQAEAGRTPLPD